MASILVMPHTVQIRCVGSMVVVWCTLLVAWYGAPCW